MLKSLHIENIAVIEQTDIDFSQGFNVLTGETGAGKSIIIDAINAVLGERTSKELIRTGCDTATVSAVFCNLSVYAKKAIEDSGYDVDDEGNLLIMRKLSQNGNGTIKINGQTATAGILKTIGKYLINIHGQHDNQSLLNPENHYIYIDRLADNEEQLRDYYAEFHHLNEIRKELASFETDEAKKQRDIELLSYQIKELKDADLKVGEAEKLKKMLSVAQNAKKMHDALHTAYRCINGDDDNDGAFSITRNAQKEISGFDTDGLKEIQNKFGEILTQLDDIAGDLRQAIRENEAADYDLSSIENRLDLIYKMTMKYGGSETSAIEFLADAEQQLKSIEMSDTQIQKLSVELDNSTARLISLADEITTSRKTASNRFKKDVTDILKYLDMPDATFDVKIDKGRYTKHGCDEIEFMIGTNAGEAVKPLSKIASGGELSRIMLAIKSVLADKDDVDTLIFDEIDAGIGGRAAQKVGHQLKQVSASRQTVCVTHLAQIAAFAQNHLLIEKSVKENRTYTLVKTLNSDDRVAEIARIMAGSNISENIINSAKELLERNF